MMIYQIRASSLKICVGRERGGGGRTKGLCLVLCISLYRMAKWYETGLQDSGYNILSKKITLFTLFHSLGSDVSDHFFWSEYRANRTRFHSLSSEFSLYWS